MVCYPSKDGRFIIESAIYHATNAMAQLHVDDVANGFIRSLLGIIGRSVVNSFSNLVKCRKNRKVGYRNYIPFKILESFTKWVMVP
jgi:hypothetical protein